EGRKHYFLVEFPQEPGALRRFLDDVLGPDDDITRFEYIKRNNRETGPALVGIELGAPENLQPILKRMEAAPHRIQPVSPDSPLFTFLVWGPPRPEAAPPSGAGPAAPHPPRAARRRRAPPADEGAGRKVQACPTPSGRWPGCAGPGRSGPSSPRRCRVAPGRRAAGRGAPGRSRR